MEHFPLTQLSRVLAATMLGLLLFATVASWAQDNQPMDLGIPGMAEASAPPPAAATSGTGSKNVTLMDMFWLGGWCMWPLLAFSLTVVGLSVYFGIDVQKKNFCPDDLYNSVEGDMAQGNLEAAGQKLGASPTCLSATLLAGFSYLSEKGFGGLDHEKLEDVMADSSRAFNRKRVRLLGYFSVLAQSAPMVGLLGTVSGMIKAFANLGREGMGDPSKLSTNISEALITTATGLIIALPAIFAFHFFRNRLQQMVHDCDERVIQLMTKLRQAVAHYHAYEASQQETASDQTA